MRLVRLLVVEGEEALGDTCHSRWSTAVRDETSQNEIIRDSDRRKGQGRAQKLGTEVREEE